MKKFVLSVIAILGSFYFAQSQYKLNDYKYVIVEKQFHFQNEENEYQLNRLVKFQFRKYGFNAIVEGEPLPEDLKSNYCLALNSEVKSKGTLRTKAVITLTDCDNNVVFTSAEGVTKEKSYDRAYELAIRKAFESFEGIGYTYIPNERVTSQGSSAAEAAQNEKAQAEIAELKAEIAELKEEKKEQAPEITPVEEVEVVESTEEVAEESEKTEEALFYKAIVVDNGFELVPSKEDMESMQIYTTGMKDVYFIKGTSGVIYQKDGTWGREYMKDGISVFEPMDIRF